MTGRGHGNTDQAHQSPKVRKTTESQHSPVRLEQTRLVSRLLYGTWTLNLPAFENEIHYLLRKRFRRKGNPGRSKNQSERSYLPQDYLATQYQSCDCYIKEKCVKSKKILKPQ